jgi:hypothetical protein
VEKRTDRSVIFIFLSGGLSQIDSFDMKPDAPEGIRGEFRPIATATPGLFICEHMPRLAATSGRWSLVRSLTHGSMEHSEGHHIVLTGRSDLPVGFDPNRPRLGDHPSIASVAGHAIGRGHNLPPAVVLPERLVHNTGRVIPGQFGGAMGPRRDPWFLEISGFDPRSYGAYPAYEFDHQRRAGLGTRERFGRPEISLPEGMTTERLAARTELLRVIDSQRALIERGMESIEGERARAVGILTGAGVRRAFDLEGAAPERVERYGANSFGWSLLLARNLVEAGVGLVQVNLGNNETWDTHGNAFPHLREKLLPPMDRAVAALLEDLEMSGLLETTLVVMAGEFGRTPRISHLAKHYELPGRDHWGHVQTVLVAGGGVKGGRVVGSSDKNGAFPASEPQTPENLGATIYEALGIPREADWHDHLDRPFAIYHGESIRGLS